jgi:exodeoxyribonuclease VII small subunit
MKNQTEDDLKALSYEQAFQELEQIVEKLENDPGSLDENMALFERGQKLSQYCTGLLEKAELKVRELSAVAPSAKENEA